MTKPAILRMPRTRAEVYRRRRITLTTLAAISLGALVAFSYDDEAEPCYIQPAKDMTWSPVNFDPAAMSAADCVFAIWEEGP